MKKQIAEKARFPMPLRDSAHMGTQFAVYEWSEERIFRWLEEGGYSRTGLTARRVFRYYRQQLAG